MKNVCVVGLGYVGLPTAILAAQNGVKVIGFDINKDRVAAVNKGNVDLTEPELKDRLEIVLKEKTFSATDTLPEADYFIIAVPTPLSIHNSADVSYVFAAVDTICMKLKKGDVVIIESTIPVGTTDLCAQIIQEKTKMKVGEDVFVAHCPERVWPSRVFEELKKNERILGGITSACSEKALIFYKTFVKGVMHLKSAKFAELLKLTENSAIDVSVALAHQVAMLAEELKFDPYEVIEIANKHPRVNILNPTCGVGGHCVAIDPWFLINSFPHKTSLFQSARFINDSRPQQVVNKVVDVVEQWCAERNEDICKVHILGLTYKPNVDDLRESPAMKVAELLFVRKNIALTITEPHAPKEKVALRFGSLISLEAGIKNADIVVSLVAHDFFKSVDLKDYVGKIWVDCAGLRWNTAEVAREEMQNKEVTANL
jgi:UDP-N-acetyl-D-mannosaminuronic acid dehydrogenase